VALNSVADGRAEIVYRIGLGEDRNSKRARCVAAFRGFFDDEYDLAHAIFRVVMSGTVRTRFRPVKRWCRPQQGNRMEAGLTLAEH